MKGFNRKESTTASSTTAPTDDYPTQAPTEGPTNYPTCTPTPAPTKAPTCAPSPSASIAPSTCFNSNSNKKPITIVENRAKSIVIQPTKPVNWLADLATRRVLKAPRQLQNPILNNNSAATTPVQTTTETELRKREVKDEVEKTDASSESKKVEGKFTAKKINDDKQSKGSCPSCTLL
jgi:hypothetical protein